MSKQPSLLAQTLGDLMKVDGRSVRVWAKILKVTEATIWQWLSDETLPPPEHIRTIVEDVRELDDAEPAIRELYRIAELPAEIITRHNKKIRKNLNFELTACAIRKILDQLLSIARTKSLPENEEDLKKFEKFIDTFIYGNKFHLKVRVAARPTGRFFSITSERGHPHMHRAVEFDVCI